MLEGACHDFCAAGNVCLAPTGDACVAEFCDPILAAEPTAECAEYFTEWFRCMEGLECSSEAMWECCLVNGPFECQATIVNMTCGSP
jgi:hypothetical protein